MRGLVFGTQFLRTLSTALARLERMDVAKFKHAVKTVFPATVLAFFSWRCGPDPQQGAPQFTDTDSVKALESDLEDVESSLAEKKDRLRDLEVRIQEQEALIVTLRDTWAGTSRWPFAENEFQEAQENIVIQTQKDRLLQQISKQEQVVATQQQLLALSVAPEESDLIVLRKQELSQAQQGLEALRNQVAELVVHQQERSAQRMIEQTQRLSATQAAQSELDLEMQSAQSDLQKLRQEREQQLAEVDQDERKSHQLGQEREVKIQLRRESVGPSR